MSDAPAPAAAPAGRALVAAHETAAPAPPPAGGAEQSEVLSALGSRIAQFTRQAPAGIDAREDLPLRQPEVSAPTQTPIQVQAHTRAPRAPRAQAKPSGGIAQASPQLAQVDLRSNAGTAGPVVMVVTPEGATTGVLVDGRGHVLTNWRSVRNYDVVLVLFKQAGGTGPAVATRSRARLVGHSKFSDLALLQVGELPPGIAPAVLAPRVEVDSGESLHAIGPGADGQWRQVVATVDRIRRNSSWYSTRRVLHRADVIRAEMADPQDVAGAPLFNNALELVGLGAMVRADKGELIGVSAGTVRAFLAAAGG